MRTDGSCEVPHVQKPGHTYALYLPAALALVQVKKKVICSVVRRSVCESVNRDPKTTLGSRTFPREPPISLVLHNTSFLMLQCDLQNLDDI